MRSVLQPNHVSEAGSAVFGPSVVHGTPFIQGLDVVLLGLTSVERQHVLISSCAFDSYIWMFPVLFLWRRRREEDVQKPEQSVPIMEVKKGLVHIYNLTSS